MKTIDYFKIPSLLLLLSLGGKAMEARDSSHELIASKKRTGTWLSITKVKKPWYAWRSLVSSRMEKSVPEYKAIPGLDEKFYSFLEGSNRFGGIYIWDKKANAEAWFLPSWFARTEKHYELKPFGIKVKIIEPGATKSNFNSESLQEYQNSLIKDYDHFVNGLKVIKDQSFMDAVLPETDAETIFQAVQDPSNRLRYLVGNRRSKSLALLRKVLPSQWFISILDSIHPLPPKSKIGSKNRDSMRETRWRRK